MPYPLSEENMQRNVQDPAGCSKMEGQDFQKLRDLQMRAARSSAEDKSSESSPEEKSRKMRLARGLINELERNGPASLVHMAAVSAAIGKPIRIFSSRDRAERIVGENSNDTVDIKYQEPDPNDMSKVGHWTLTDDKDPQEEEAEVNGCLFAVVAAQTGESPKDLRAKTVSILRQNIKRVADCIDQIIWLEENDKIILMIGGARYRGRSSRDAKYILDASQNTYCHNCPYPGHPRGHASHPHATGPYDSVENYSRQGWKTGFLSREDQDYVAHLALSHRIAQDAMRSLNEGSTSEAVRVPRWELEKDGDEMPKAKEYVNGEAISGEQNFSTVQLVLRHHSGQQNNPDADVFVHTMYPRL